jgi:hypothetical protein
VGAIAHQSSYEGARKLRLRVLCLGHIAAVDFDDEHGRYFHLALNDGEVCIECSMILYSIMQMRSIPPFTSSNFHFHAIHELIQKMRKSPSANF